MTHRRQAIPLLIALLVFSTSAFADRLPGMPAGKGRYSDLVELYDEFLRWQDDARARKLVPNRDIAGAAAERYPDYGTAAIEQRRATMQDFQRRLEDMAVVDWPREQQVDYLAIRSRFDQHDFHLNVSRPWSRDPGFYVDRMLRLTFTELPVSGDDALNLRTELAAVTLLVDQAKNNLTDVAADYADLAIYNLTHADGVGHGYPYRATPPAGVIGWYDDLLRRATESQPELVPEIEAARDAVISFHDWLVAERPSMTGRAGVGKAAFDWYLKHVKLMPWTSGEIVTLGMREFERLWSKYALARHANRNLPELTLPANAEEYRQRIAAVDRNIREFLVRESIITIPDYIGELATNAPWIERPSGPNFWEQVQYRDPTPDHLHAVIPGHRFDGLVERNNPHPVRSRLTSGARAEGWGVYLEEGMLEAGLEVNPRVRELIYIFGIFRAARVPADVWLQLNEKDVQSVVDWWLERVPYLDPDVARVDAEIYLRRPPGYGLGYTMGNLQMSKLLADRMRQLGDDFVLKDFHDEFMAAGRLPLSLIRWEMTGLADEVESLWPRERLNVIREQ